MKFESAPNLSDHKPGGIAVPALPVMHPYRAAWWIPGAHAHTLWGKLVPRPCDAVTRTERWETPDGDFLELERLDAPEDRPRLIVLHGLEGSARSHYARGLLHEAARRRWAADVLIFRSCGRELNRLPQCYHSGDTRDLDFLVQTLSSAQPQRPLVVVGVSLGGNVLLKWLGERGRTLPSQVKAAAAISVPYDLARSSRRVGHGFSRVYEAWFLRSLRQKARAKERRFPDAVRRRAIARAHSLYAFDDGVTAPLHGFRDAADYYGQCSAIRFIAGIRVPTLLLSARDDPFLPCDVLDDVSRIAHDNPALHTEFVNRGGHVGFVSGRIPWRPFYYAEWRATEFLSMELIPTYEAL